MLTRLRHLAGRPPHTPHRTRFGHALRVASVLLMLSLAVACSDDSTEGPETPDVPNGTDCSAETFSLILNDPTVSDGFAPLDTVFDGRISTIQEIDYAWTLDFGDGQTQTSANKQPSDISKLYSEPGNYTATLTVTDTTCNKSKDASVQINVRAPVELTGEGLSGRPGNVSVGDELRVTMDVLNTSGADLILPLTVEFFLSNRPVANFSDLDTITPLGSVVLDPQNGVTIPASGRTDVDGRFVVPDTVSTNSYFVIAAIDRENSVGEENEERNNVIVSEAPVFVENILEDTPDLAVSQVRIGPATAFRSLTTVILNADIANIGSRFADGVEYAVYIQENNEVFDPEIAREIFKGGIENSGSIGFQPPNNVYEVRGQNIIIDPPIELPEEQEEESLIYVFVVADPDNVIIEDNEDGTAETNNFAAAQNPISLSNEAQSGVDIVLINYGFAPTATYLDGPVRVTLEVANYGTEPTRSFFCGIYLSDNDSFEPAQDQPIVNINFSNIEPSDEPIIRQDSIIIPGFIATGEYYTFAFCDPSDAVRETFEDNNLVRLPEQITITSEAVIDLAASDVTLSAEEIDDGGSLTLNATISNDGLNGAGPSILRIRRSLDAIITNSDEVIAEVEIDPIEAGASLPIEVALNELFCDIFQNQYFIGLQVDARNQVAEQQESNNLVVLETPLRINGDRCDCVEDDFEENDTPPTAAILAETGTVENLAICTGGNVDYYAVDLVLGQSLFVSAALTHEGDDTNLDLRILDPNYQQISTAISNTDGPLEQASLFLVQQEGRYIIEVSGRSGDDVNEYTLTTDITTPGPGVDLTAAQFSLSNLNPALAESVTASFTTLNTSNDDAPAYDITLYLSTDTEVDPTDFNLGTTTVDDGLQGARTRPDAIDFIIPVDATDGNYFVCVVLDSGDAIDETNEDNNTFCSPQIEVDTSCYDPFEVNDSFETATALDPGSYENLTVCDNGRVDIYRFCALNGQRVVATAEFTHSQGDVELRLFRDIEGASPDEIDSSTGVRNSEEVEVEYVNGDQCYFLEVSLKDPLNLDPDGANEYTLDLVVEAADPTLACVDPFEPNGNFDEAVASGSDLQAVLNQDLQLDRCPANDIDYFYIDLVAGPEITICIENDADNDQDYQFNVALSDPSQQQIAANSGTNPCITETLAVSGRYFLRVLSTNRSRRSVRYRVSLEGLFGTDLVGQDFNLLPSDIIPGETVLVYNFSLQNARTERAENITYGLYYSPDGPIIDPETDLLLTTGSVAGLDGFSNTAIEDVIIVPESPVFESGEGFIGIFIDPANTVEEVNENNNRGLFAPVNVLVCDDDTFAGNSTRSLGADIDPATTYEDLAICPGTEDWYCTDLTAGLWRVNAAFVVDADNRLGTDLNLEVQSVDINRNRIDTLGTDLSIGSDSSVDISLDADTSICVRVFPLTDSATNTYSLTVQPLEGDPGVDLSASNLNATPDVDVIPGETEVSYSFTLQNGALDAASDVAYTLYFSADNALDADTDLVLTTGSVDEVTGLGVRTINDSFVFPADASLVSGPGFFFLSIDPANAIAENDEDNNTASVNITLVLAGECADDELAGNVDAENAATFTLDEATNDLVLCSETEDWFCQTLDAGDYPISVAFVLDPDAPAESDLNVRVSSVNDAFEEIAELALDEEEEDGTNLTVTVAEDDTTVCIQIFAAQAGGTNTYSLLVETPETPLADLSATALSTDADPVLADGATAFDLSYTLTNTGDAASGAFSVAVVYSASNTVDADDLVLTTFDVDNIDAGAELSDVVSAILVADPNVEPGGGTIGLVIDFAADVEETDEDNNTITTDVIVSIPAPEVDLAGTLTVDPSELIADGATAFDATVAVSNDSDAEITNISVVIVYSEDDVIDGTDFVLATETVTAPANGASSDIFSITLPDDVAVLDGAGFIGLIVDADDANAETDEDNNTASAPVNVSRPVVVDCTDDAFEGNTDRANFQRVFTNFTYNDLVSCPAVDDWYCVIPAAAGNYTIDLTFALDAPGDEASDLDIEVTNFAGAPIAETNNVGDNASITFDTAADNFCFRVFGHTPEATNDYTLRITPNP